MPRMSQYKLVTYQGPQDTRAGLVVGETVFDLAAATGRPSYATMLGLLRDWDGARGLLRDAATSAAKRTDGRPLRSTTLLPPVPTPAGIFCAGANFSDHMMEMAQVQNIAPEPDPHSLGLNPWHFIKATHCLAAPDSTVKLPAYSKMVDWEAELTAVIGRPARNVAIANALNHVAGYTIANDLSARDFTKRPHVADGSPFKYDWLGQKCFDGACPLGPWIVPADDARAAERRHQAHGQRRDQAGFPHQQDDLHAGGADRAPLDARDASTRRSDPHRHARRRRARAQGVPQARRRGEGVDRGDRNS